MLRSRSLLLIFTLAILLFSARSAGAQEGQDIIRINHRVVFLDVLVKDKRTNGPVPDLKKTDFEVLADGKPRTISYFTREGDQGRRPLALVIVLDLRRDGAGRFLRRTEILEAMAAELAKLPAQDEVAVVALKARGSNDKHEWLTHLTKDRAQVAAALSLVPTLVAEGSSGEDHTPPASGEKDPASSKPDKGAKTDDKKKEKAAAAAKSDAAPENEKDEIESETKMVGEDGSVVTRTVYRSGRVESKRVSKSGTVTMSFDDDLDMGSAATETAGQTIKERPDSQGVMVWVSDGIAPLFYVERDFTAATLIKANVTFSALVADMKTGYKLFMPVLKPLGNMVGLNIYGGAQHIARQTGGEAVRVRRPEEYAEGLNKIIGNLTSRYSLGFTLTEAEQDDGKMHPLEVRVKARDAKGKARKLSITSRLGYFMPKEGESASSK